MKKDAYWFKHDSTAGRGLRMRKMAHIYGHWGKGIYWDVIEILRDQSNYCFDSDDSSLQMLADLIGCKDESKFLSWFRDCIRFELFLIQDNKFFSEVMCENMEVWETKKGNGGKGGRPKKTETITESITESKPKHEPNRNHKIIEDKIIENNSIIFDFKKSMCEYGFKENLISEWLKVRKNKKATNTETAFNKFIIQVELTKKDKNKVLEICIERSWSGFNAEWIKSELDVKKQTTAPDYAKFISGE